MFKLLLPLLFISTIAISQEVKVGRTWDIVEPDPMELAKERAKNIPPERLKPKNTYRDRLSAKHVMRTISEKSRTYTPSHTVEKEIIDKDGNVIYPVGYTFNPIEFMRQYDNRIVIIDEGDAQVIKDKLVESDIVIINKGDISTTAQLLERRVSMLDIFTAEALNIKSVPAFVTIDYNAQVYQITEFNPDIRVPL